jgi:branched-chain amino acid transport system substrate-binding protein
MTPSIQRLFTGASAAVLLLAGCQARTPDPVTRDIVIGVAWPWQDQKDVRFDSGLQLAVDEINGAGGIRGRPLRLQRSDDKQSVDEGRLVAQRLASDPAIVAVIGHLQSYVTVPAAAIYDLAGKVMLAPAATDPELTSLGYQRVFRATFTDRTVGEQMADYAASHNLRRVAIFYIRNTYGRGLANAFEERATGAGLSIVARNSYDASEQISDRTFAATLDDWSHVRMDAIFLAGEVPSGAVFIAEARKHGLTAPVLAGDALGTDALIRIAGAAAEGTVVATDFHPDEPGVQVKRFVAAYTSRYGAQPDVGAALGYDAVRLLADAMNRAAGVNSEAIARALHATHGWQGATGEFTFDSTGSLVTKSVVRMVVRDGRFAYLDGGSTTPLVAVH